MATRLAPGPSSAPPPPSHLAQVHVQDGAAGREESKFMAATDGEEPQVVHAARLLHRPRQ